MSAPHAFTGGLMAAGECNGLLAQWGRAAIIAPPATHDGRGCRFESGTGDYLSGGYGSSVDIQRAKQSRRSIHQAEQRNVV